MHFLFRVFVLASSLLACCYNGICSRAAVHSVPVNPHTYIPKEIGSEEEGHEEAAYARPSIERRSSAGILDQVPRDHIILQQKECGGGLVFNSITRSSNMVVGNFLSEQPGGDYHCVLRRRIIGKEARYLRVIAEKANNNNIADACRLSAEFCNSEQLFKRRKLPMAIYLSICARLFESGKIDAYWLCEFFANSPWQGLACKLFTVDGAPISRSVLYATGVYLYMLSQFKRGQQGEKSNWSNLYKNAYQTIDDEGVPDGNCLSWSFKKAYDDKETQQLALRFMPILFFD
jgi:hypothetical protein